MRNNFHNFKYLMKAFDAAEKYFLLSIFSFGNLKVYLKRYFLFVFLTSSPGCYITATISDLNSKTPENSPVFKVDNPGGSEFVSGGNQYETTPIRRYQIRSSSGNYNREIKLKTPNGYSIYSSVQGALISGQEGV